MLTPEFMLELEERMAELCDFDIDYDKIREDRKKREDGER